MPKNNDFRLSDRLIPTMNGQRLKVETAPTPRTFPDTWNASFQAKYFYKNFFIHTSLSRSPISEWEWIVKPCSHQPGTKKSQTFTPRTAFDMYHPFQIFVLFPIHYLTNLPSRVVREGIVTPKKCGSGMKRDDEPNQLKIKEPLYESPPFGRTNS